MRRLISLALIATVCLAIGAVAIDIDLVTTNEGQLDAEADPQGLTVAATFSTKGGTAAALETHTLLLDGEPAVRLLHVDGELNGKQAELALVTTSMPKRMRNWIKSFIAGKYKKHAVALVTKTGTGPDGKTLYSRFDYKGVMIREVQFPALGKEGGKFYVHLMYQSATETKNQKPVNMLDVPIRSQFFKFSLGGKDGKDKEGAKLGKSVYAVDTFSIVRSSGMGKQDGSSLTLSFPNTVDTSDKKKDGILPMWKKWFGKDKKTERHGKLTLYYWTGASMDHGSEASRGQLKVLFELHLNDIAITKLNSGDGKAVVNAGNIDMSDH